MTEKTPLRFLLRYDPVFLELTRSLRSQLWGDAIGASVQAVVSSTEDSIELIAGLQLVFGFPGSARYSFDGCLSNAILVFGTDFAMTVEIVAAPNALRDDRPFMLVGSLNCDRSLVEFRLGAEKSLSYLGSSASPVTLPIAEGDGARYRIMDLAAVGGPLIVTDTDDIKALARARKIVLDGGIG